jgi:hypothetical protein
MSIQSKKALLIGINYLSIPANILKGCINDIENMQEVLIGGLQYNSSNIVMMRDDLSGNVVPTRQNILDHLNSLVSVSSSCSEIWIHYSGHGTQIPNISDQSVTIDASSHVIYNMDQALVPVDYMTAGFITDKELFSIIKNIKCRAFLIFDCCHSASLCDLEWEFQYISNNNYNKKQYSNKVISNPNIYMISGCKDSQISLSVFDISLNEYVGVLTESLIHCLKTMKYTGSIMTLHENICTRILNKGYLQTPILSCTVENPSYTFGIIFKTAVNLGVMRNPLFNHINASRLPAYQAIYKKIYEYTPNTGSAGAIQSRQTIHQNMKSVLQTKGYVNR